MPALLSNEKQPLYRQQSDVLIQMRSLVLNKETYTVRYRNYSPANSKFCMVH